LSALRVNGKPSQTGLDAKAKSLVAVLIAEDVADSADLTTAARGKWSEEDSVLWSYLDSSEVTLMVSSMLSTDIGTLSPRISLTSDILEANGR